MNFLSVCSDIEAADEIKPIDAAIAQAQKAQP
jgi:hypothetical protein